MIFLLPLDKMNEYEQLFIALFAPITKGGKEAALEDVKKFAGITRIEKDKYGDIKFFYHNGARYAYYDPFRADMALDDTQKKQRDAILAKVSVST
jgi:hypothetical protein